MAYRDPTTGIIYDNMRLNDMDYMAEKHAELMALKEPQKCNKEIMELAKKHGLFPYIALENEFVLAKLEAFAIEYSKEN